MKIVIVGSTNPMKVAVTKEAFGVMWPEEVFECIPYAASSLVSDQPRGIKETMVGAHNRTEACRMAYPDADYFVGLEGGIEDVDGVVYTSAWMCVKNQDGQTSFGRTGAFALPPQIIELLEAGTELGHATDIIFNQTNSKHQHGAVGALTNNRITRTSFYLDAMVFALIPFLRTDLY